MHRKVFALSVAMASLSHLAPGQAADLAAKVTPPPVVQQWTGWYAITGSSFPLGRDPNSLTESGCVYLCGKVDLGIDTGYSLFAGAGYRFSPSWRADLQFQYGSAQVSNNNVVGHLPAAGFTGLGQLHGTIGGTTVALDGYYDFAPLFAPGTLGNFEPYVGAGVLYTSAAATNITWASSTGIGVTATFPNTTATSFGWQAIAGTAYRLTRNWLVDVAYIYRDYGRFHSGNITPSGLPAAAPTSSFTAAAQGSGMNVAVRYEF
jgi:opacity protein-like surface antigen